MEWYCSLQRHSRGCGPELQGLPATVAKPDPYNPANDRKQESRNQYRIATPGQGQQVTDSRADEETDPNEFFRHRLAKKRLYRTRIRVPRSTDIFSSSAEMFGGKYVPQNVNFVPFVAISSLMPPPWFVLQ